MRAEEMRAQVETLRSNAAHARDLVTNFGVIRSRMADNYDKNFALYSGGDAHRMAATLASLGYSMSVSGSTVWCRV